MTTFLLTFLPSQFRAQWWFLDYNFSYFALESGFVRNDFLLLCQFYSYVSAVETIDETHAFLVRMHTKGVKWLIFLPDTLFIRRLFAGYRFYPLGSSQTGIRGLVITNYKVYK
jgi:hypothetical protein